MMALVTTPERLLSDRKYTALELQTDFWFLMVFQLVFGEPHGCRIPPPQTGMGSSLDS